VLAALILGAATASADPKTGFVLEVTCGSETATIISPSGPAAVGHDIESTEVFVVAVAAIEAPAGRFPVGKVMLCDFKDLTTGTRREDVPFLVTGAPWGAGRDLREGSLAKNRLSRYCSVERGWIKLKNPN
jgi:hypothetical protein